MVSGTPSFSKGPTKIYVEVRLLEPFLTNRQLSVRIHVRRRNFRLDLIKSDTCRAWVVASYPGGPFSCFMEHLRVPQSRRLELVIIGALGAFTLSWAGICGGRCGFN
jgi:hypothetical protein